VKTPPDGSTLVATTSYELLPAKEEVEKPVTGERPVFRSRDCALRVKPGCGFQGQKNTVKGT
jgi:hypothetical protein